MTNDQIDQQGSRLFRIRRLALAATLCLTYAALWASAVSYTLVDLETFGGTYSVGNAINANGWVTGYAPRPRDKAICFVPEYLEGSE